jgi:hypothetical protein
MSGARRVANLLQIEHFRLQASTRRHGRKRTSSSSAWVLKLGL